MNRHAPCKRRSREIFMNEKYKGGSKWNQYTIIHTSHEVSKTIPSRSWSSKGRSRHDRSRLIIRNWINTILRKSQSPRGKESAKAEIKRMKKKGTKLHFSSTEFEVGL